MSASRDNDQTAPAYGASDHYDHEYFTWQDAGSDIKVRYKTLHFEPHVLPHDTVLDFGCAGGALLNSLNCRRRVGVEINPAARAAAEVRGVKAFAVLDQVPDQLADVAISSHTLEHVPDPYTALTQLRRKIKPGGKLVLLLPIDDWRRGRRYSTDDINHHLYTWTPLLLGNLLTEAGYSVHGEDLVVIRHALMRHFEKFDALLPRPVFDRLCKVWAHIRHSQEMVAVAKPTG